MDRSASSWGELYIYICILSSLSTAFVACDTVSQSVWTTLSVRVLTNIQRAMFCLNAVLSEYKAALYFWIQNCGECRDPDNVWELFCVERNEDLVKMINMDIYRILKQWSGKGEWQRDGMEGEELDKWRKGWDGSEFDQYVVGERERVREKDGVILASGDIKQH